MLQKKILFFVSEDGYFCSHRLSLASAIIKLGYEVILVTKVTKYRNKIEKIGIRVIDLNLSRESINPFKEIIILFERGLGAISCNRITCFIYT